MKRRTFLQLGGMTAASALLAGCQSKNEKLIPYLIPPDEGVTPGLAMYYASSCTFCPAGCGIVVRVSEGRAKKIEGNPKHPVNRGRLCAKGQAILQELYHPDRLQQPLKRSGPRGSGQFEKISWAEALDLLTARLKDLQRDHAANQLALLTPHLSASLASLTDRFMNSYGSSHYVSYEPCGVDWLQQASTQSFGQPAIPFYDIAESRYLLSFGADFIESHLSPVQFGNAFGRMRQGRDTVRGHFTYVGGRMSLTAASADRWMPVRPGSEGILALGMARIILTESLHDRSALAENGLGAEELLRKLQSYDLSSVAERTGLTGEAIMEVAREFATTRPSLAMVGESVAHQSNGPESVRSVQLLNLLAGSLNRPGGVYPTVSPTSRGNSFSDLMSLAGTMNAGQIKIALIKGNPLHTIPPATGFQKSLDKVPFIVTFPTLLDDTALLSDLILPDHSALESWGDVIPLGGSRHTVYGVMQPVVSPLHDTRQFGDVLLAVASRIGGAPARALPHTSLQELVRETARTYLLLPGKLDFEAQWVELLQRGGQFESATRKVVPYRWRTPSALPEPGMPSFAGDEIGFPLHLQLYRSSAFHDGRGAAFPWLQQMPDPMSTVVWGSWIEINPATATGLGISHGDLIEVASPQGTIRLPAVLYPGIRPDLVAIPLGQGHKGSGRYAANRGVNPLELLVLMQGDKQHASWNATRVRITRISNKGDLVTAGHPQGSYRSDLIGI